MSLLLLNIALALIWMLLTGFQPGNLLAGFVLGYFTLLITRRALGTSDYFARVPQLFSFLLFFLKEMLVANLRVAADVVTPMTLMQPRIIAVPLEAHTQAEIVMLANLISLTPGTLSLDVSGDNRVLYIHAMYARDPDVVRANIKNEWERRVNQLMRTQAQPPREAP